MPLLTVYWFVYMRLLLPTMYYFFLSRSTRMTQPTSYDEVHFFFANNISKTWDTLQKLILPID